MRYLIKSILFYRLVFASLLFGVLADAGAVEVYDATISGREILTPAAPVAARINGATIFGVRSGKPIFFRVCASGEKPIEFSAKGLPAGVSIDNKSGWITGPKEDTLITLSE